MAKYSIKFARQMAIAASSLLATSPPSKDRDRAALYVSLVACEVALKSALEQAGKPVTEIRVKSHNLPALLDQVGSCSVPNPSINNRLVSASRIRAIVVDNRYATIGHLLCGEEVGASKFPNEVRYGSILRHFPAKVMAEAANKVCSWVEKHYSSIKV